MKKISVLMITAFLFLLSGCIGWNMAPQDATHLSWNPSSSSFQAPTSSRLSGPTVTIPQQTTTGTSFTTTPTMTTTLPTFPSTIPTAPSTIPTSPTTQPTKPATFPTIPSTVPAEPPAVSTVPSTVPAQPDANIKIVTYTPKVVNDGKTFTGFPSLPVLEYPVMDPENLRKLSTERISHSFGVASNGEPHSITVNNQKRFDKWGTGALAWDNISEEKVLYLTFDCGYEYKNLTSQMLDVLKEKKVQATFFVTMSYMRSSPQVVARMITEGHNVGNHSLNHPTDCAALSREEMALEALAVENYLRVNFGYTSKYFRFPSGVYSESAVEVLNSLGYRSVFWSIAYADWDPEDQVGPEKALQTVTDRLHPGAVILLHTTSPDNAKILGDFIDYAISQGYRFANLDAYPGWK